MQHPQWRQRRERRQDQRRTSCRCRRLAPPRHPRLRCPSPASLARHKKSTKTISAAELVNGAVRQWLPDNQQRLIEAGMLEADAPPIRSPGAGPILAQGTSALVVHALAQQGAHGHTKAAPLIPQTRDLDLPGSEFLGVDPDCFAKLPIAPRNRLFRRLRFPGRRAGHLPDVIPLGRPLPPRRRQRRHCL